MIVDTSNPEVREQLAHWFRTRDELFEERSQDMPNSLTVYDLLEELVDVGDELVGFLCPTKADKERLG